MFQNHFKFLKNRISRPTLFFCVFLVFSSFAVYFQLWDYDFLHYDDEIYVTQNRHVLTGLTSEGISWAFGTTDAEFWHPFTWLSHMLVIELFGADPGWHHLTNLFLHILSSLLLFFFLKMATGNFWKSAVVAALFALHPLNVESVAWIAERKGVLCAFFWMLSLWSYARYVKRPGILRYLMVAIFFVLGFMAKAMIITLPFVLLLLDYWPLNRSKNQTNSKTGVMTLILEKVPLFVLSGILGFVTLLAQKGGGKLSTLEAYPIGLRLANAVISYVAYIGKTFWPFSLSIFYPIRDDINSWQVAGAAILLGTITIAVIVLRRKSPYLLVGWLWFIGVLLPVAQIIQVGIHSMADRYAYLPTIGLFIMFAWGIPDLLPSFQKKRFLLGAIAGTAIFIFALTSWFQTRYWKNSVVLFEHSAELVPNNFVAYNILGRAMEEAGETAEAIEQYRKCVALAPDYSDGHYNLANALTKEGNLNEAIEHYEYALKTNPNFLRAHMNLGNLMAKVGKESEALRHYTEALKIRKNYPYAHYNIGNILARQGKEKEAIKHYLAVIKEDPYYAEAYYNLGNSLVKQGNIAAGISYYRKSLELKPNFLEPHINLANIYSKKGEFSMAIEHYECAVRLDPKNASVHYYLGNLLSKRGETAKAISHYQKALELKPDFQEAHINMAAELQEIGKTEEAMNHYQEVLKINSRFDAYVFYNLACIHSKEGRISEAVGYIEKSIQKGFSDWKLLQTDDDLKNIRETKRFQEIIAQESGKP